MWELRITNMGIWNIEILNLSGMAESHPEKITLPQFSNSVGSPAIESKELAKIVWHMLTKDEEYNGFPRRDPVGKRQDDESHHSNLLATTHKPGRITERGAHWAVKLAPFDWEMGCWFGIRSGMLPATRNSHAGS